MGPKFRGEDKQDLEVGSVGSQEKEEPGLGKDRRQRGMQVLQQSSSTQGLWITLCSVAGIDLHLPANHGDTPVHATAPSGSHGGWLCRKT